MNLIKTADAPHNGFKIVVRYEEAETVSQYNTVAHSFRYALIKAGNLSASPAARGYEGILYFYLDGVRVDTSLSCFCLPSGVFITAIYQGSLLRIGQGSEYNNHSYIVWYGQIIKISAEILFLLEVRCGSPLTPPSTDQKRLVQDGKIRRFTKICGRCRLRSPCEQIQRAFPEIGIYRRIV